MDSRNETESRVYRFLSEDHFAQLYATFIEAFSDYVFPFALTETQFRNYINVNGVDLNRTIGCIEDDRLIGFSLNGFGEWNGCSTMYDAGTGVIPPKRRLGIGKDMFERMLPGFIEQGIEQCLLEVVTTNTGAVKLYEQLDFHPIRELALLQCDHTFTSPKARPTDVEIRDLEKPDWLHLATFWDGQPSWQNSIDAQIRTHSLKRKLGAYIGDECVGYIVFSNNFGRLAQIAVGHKHRNRGIGSLLLKHMQSEIADGYSAQVINIDKALEVPMQFFRNRGFHERISQYEMLKEL